MIDKIYNLLEAIEIPVLALDNKDEIVYANNYFRNVFLSKNSNVYQSLNQLNNDWLRVNFKNDLVIINKNTLTFLYSIKVMGFYDPNISDDNYIKVYNFDFSNNENFLNPKVFFENPKDTNSNNYINKNIPNIYQINNPYIKEPDVINFGKDMLKIENDKFVFNVSNFAYIKEQLLEMIRFNISDEIAKKIDVQIQIYCFQIISYFNKKSIYLNDTECKVLLYSFFNISTKEISEIEKKSDRTIQNAKYILRKKFELKRNQLIKDIIDFEIR